MSGVYHVDEVRSQVQFAQSHAFLGFGARKHYTIGYVNKNNHKCVRKDDLLGRFCKVSGKISRESIDMDEIRGLILYC